MIRPVLSYTLIIVLLFGMIGLSSCSESPAEKNTAEGTQTTQSQKESTTSPNVFNPNQASKEQLASLPQLTDELVESILENRPFLSQMALHSILSPSLSEDAMSELYVKLFVPLNLNTASREEILLTPGIGEKMAHEFEEYRPYKAMAQFRREMAKYVDDEEVARMEQYVFVPINLNTASDAEILAIPGMGKKMLHEFKEYRPYKNIEQFRREIGKYVDEKEVARLERYVTLEAENM